MLTNIWSTVSLYIVGMFIIMAASENQMISSTEIEHSLCDPCKSAMRFTSPKKALRSGWSSDTFVTGTSGKGGIITRQEWELKEEIF